MMKNKTYTFLLCFIFACLFISCKKNGFTVKGDFSNNTHTYCVLDEIQPYDVIPIDTILLINNKFNHFVPCTEKSFYRIRFTKENNISFIAGDKDVISITADLNDTKKTQNISGNEESVLFLEVNKKIHEMYLITDSLSKIFVEYKGTDQFDSICNHLDSCYYQNFEYYQNYLKDFIIQHPNKLASISAFYQKIGHRPFFSVTENRELIEKMVKELSISYPNNQHVKALKEKLSDE
ncbi:MAG: DUF4369 domain-containing protein [Bacteroidales bacterium]|nr:DUF4369 domain-containing protein [Bacteroidales bacterium]